MKVGDNWWVGISEVNTIYADVDTSSMNEVRCVGVITFRTASRVRGNTLYNNSVKLTWTSSSLSQSLIF